MVRRQQFFQRMKIKQFPFMATYYKSTLRVLITANPYWFDGGLWHVTPDRSSFREFMFNGPRHHREHQKHVRDWISPHVLFPL